MTQKDVKAKKWEKKPKGWDEESLVKYLKTITEGRKHRVTKCIEKLKGVESVDNPGALCASLVDKIEGTGWREGPRKKHKKSETASPTIKVMSPKQILEKEQKQRDAVSQQQLQTQKKYTQEKGKQQPAQPGQKKTEKKEPKKEPGKFKQWLKKTLNFPEEQEATATSSRKVRKPMARRRSSFSDLAESTPNPRDRYSRRRRWAKESPLVREHNKEYELPSEDDSAPWVEDDYADRAKPYGMKEKMPKNEREAMMRRLARRRSLRRRMAMRRSVAERREERIREARLEEMRERWAERRREARMEERLAELRRRRRMALLERTAEDENDEDSFEDSRLARLARLRRLARSRQARRSAYRRRD